MNSLTGSQPIHHHTLDNGVTLIAEPMPWLESAAFAIAVPAGYRYDPIGKQGLGNLVCEMVQRGCGKLNSRQFLESLEILGVDFYSNVSTYHTVYSAALQYDRLLPALEVFADLLKNPWLLAEQLEDARAVCIQESNGLEDDLNQKVMLELRKQFYGTPDGNHSEGTPLTLAELTLSDVKNFWQSHYAPDQAIIACAGRFDWEALRKKVERLLGQWDHRSDTPVEVHPPEHGIKHIDFDSEQTHLAIAFPTVPYAHPDYWLCRGAVGVLSGGLSSRLFHEVREKRGLCYSVYASCHSLKEKGAVFTYSGTSSDRAQETLDVVLHQLQSLHNGITPDELRRLKIQVRTSLVAQQESCRSRANGLAGDWFHLGRVKTLDQLNQQIESMTVESINDFLDRNRPNGFDIVTLGNQPLKTTLNGISTI